MKLYKFFILVLFTLVFSKVSKAQDHDDSVKNDVFRPWEFRVNVGYNIGGTIPIPFPAEIREIQKFSPKAFAPHLAFEGIYWFNEKWGVSAQFTFDLKGFSTTDSVVNLPTTVELKNSDGSIQKYTGNFTGINSMSVNNSYFTVPISAVFRPSKRWLVEAGIYLAYLYSPKFEAKAISGYIRDGGPTGEKTYIDENNAPEGQDFSDNERGFDWGVQASGEWYFTKRFSVRLQFAYGIPTLFESGFTTVPFDLHNVFGTIGVGYTFRKL